MACSPVISQSRVWDLVTCAILVPWTQCLQTLIKTHWKWTGLKILLVGLSKNEAELGSGILKCSGQKGKMVPLSARAHCLADVIITLRVHVCTMRRTLPVWASGDKVVFMQCAELQGRNIVEQ